MPQPIMYLASPYTHPDKAIQHLRYLAARETAAHLMRNGTLVFSPIVHCHWMAVLHGLPGSIEFWRDYDFAMIEALPRFSILKLPGWVASKGIEEERTFALSLGREIDSTVPFGTYADILAKDADGMSSR